MRCNNAMIDSYVMLHTVQSIQPRRRTITVLVLILHTVTCSSYDELETIFARSVAGLDPKHLSSLLCHATRQQDLCSTPPQYWLYTDYTKTIHSIV